MTGAAGMVAVALLSVGAEERELIDGIAAVVNDEVITISEVKKAEAPYIDRNPQAAQRASLRKTVLDQLINERLLSQQVAEAKVTVSPDEVERAIEDILRQNRITRAELREAVTSRGMSMSQYREDLERQLVRLKLVDLKVRSRVVVPEAEVRAEYERQTRGVKPNELLTLRHLFVSIALDADDDARAAALARITAARDRVVAGESFEAVARETNDGPTRGSGGSLGEIEKRGLLPELAEALEDAKVGTLTDPIVTRNGIHVLKVEAQRFERAEGYEAAHDRIYQELYKRRVEQQMQVWLNEIRDQSAVDVRM